MNPSRIILLVFFSALYFLNYVPRQSDFVLILIPYVLAFSGYLWICFKSNLSLSHLFLIALASRMLLIPSVPNLSDDIYRFIWDGSLIWDGISPYRYVPSQIIHEGFNSYTGLYDKLNSPNYYSVYPPISQFYFWIASISGIDHVLSFSIVCKAFYLLTEFGIWFYLFRTLRNLKQAKWAAIYLLNPLIITEHYGNLHFEGLMISFLALSLYMLYKSRFILSGILLSISVGVKLLPLMFLPLLWKYSGWSKKFIVSASLSCFIIFLPVVIGLDVLNFIESIDLYFGKFEFNASIHYLLRYFSLEIVGYNLIRYTGISFGLMTLVFIAYKTSQLKIRDFSNLAQSCFWVFVLYLLSATTVHPWYLSLVLFWIIFYRQNWIILWSLMIYGTYINYSYEPYAENLWVVLIEYSLVLIFLWIERRASLT